MLQVIKHKLQHLYQINRSNNSSSLVISKNSPFDQKVDKKNFEWKSMFFFPTSLPFLLLPATFQPYLICETQFYQNCHTAKAPAFQNISSIFGNQFGNSYYSMAKVRKPISLQSKRPKFVLKAVWRKNYHCKPHFFSDSEICMSHFWLGTIVNPDKFSRHEAKISSTLWD